MPEPETDNDTEKKLDEETTTESKKDTKKDTEKVTQKKTSRKKKDKDEKPDEKKGKKGKDKKKEEGSVAEEKVKKKYLKAKAIDETQAKRLVKAKRTAKKKTRKVVRAVKPTIEPRNIGVEVTPPTESCTDPLCPFHGKLSVRGQIINAVVVSSKMNKTAIVQKEVRRYAPKFERYEKRTQKYAVHNPECLNVQRGDMVKIMECRPLSKAKSFVVIEKL